MNPESSEIIRENPRLQGLLDATHGLREAARNHRLLARLDALPDLRVVMEHHVFAVWDFMTLVKALQRSLTCLDLPWRPRGERLSRRLVNEVVLEEESDEDGQGGYASHLELYLEAMREAGADERPIRSLIGALEAGASAERALASCGGPRAALDFARATLAAASSGRPHQVAAAFALGREDVIPDMFFEAVWRVRERFPAGLPRFVHYLERHVSVDGDRHAPLALRLVAVLCGADETLWREAAEAARGALEARLALWEAVEAALAPARIKERQPC